MFIAGINLQQMDKRVGAIIDMQEFAPRRPASPDRKFPQTLRFRLMGLSDQRWEHMTGVQIEIIAGAIEVGRHGRNVVASVLLTVGLTELDAGNLGDGVRLI